MILDKDKSKLFVFRFLKTLLDLSDSSQSQDTFECIKHQQQ